MIWIIVPQLDDVLWKKLIDSIWELGITPRIPESKERIQSVENIKTWIREKNLLALSFRSPTGKIEIDLLISEADNFERLKRNAYKIELGGHLVYVASIDDLIKMKQQAGRPKDLLDIETLKRIKARKG